jgi:hypothetical protein
VEVNLDKFIPNPVQKAIDSPNGKAMIKVVVAGAGGREEYFVKQGEQMQINGVDFNFTNQVLPNAFNVFLEADTLSFSVNQTVSQTVMATQKQDTLQAGGKYPLRLRSLYSVGGSNFVIGDFVSKVLFLLNLLRKKSKNESMVGLNMTVKVNGQAQRVMVTGRKGEAGEPQVLTFGNTNVSISYGSKQEVLLLLCKDFELEKYPGTENPSSYASEVKLIDQANNVNQDTRIYMNHILDYDGYRFFQSSYDNDELGTYLSVNHDYWGTLFSYLGYFLLTIGMVMTFFMKNSRFAQLIKKLQEYQKSLIIFCLLSVKFNWSSLCRCYFANSRQSCRRIWKIICPRFQRSYQTYEYAQWRDFKKSC